MEGIADEYFPNSADPGSNEKSEFCPYVMKINKFHVIHVLICIIC